MTKLYSIIRLSPQGGSDLDPYVQDLLSFKPDFDAGGVRLEEFRTRSIDLISTLVITIVGVVASHYIVKCIDALLLRKEQSPSSSVRIVIELKGVPYELPAQQAEIMELIGEEESDK